MQDEDDLRQQLPPPPSQMADTFPYEPRVRRGQLTASKGGQDNYHDRYGSPTRNGENPPGMLALEDKLEKYAEGLSSPLQSYPSTDNIHGSN